MKKIEKFTKALVVIIIVGIGMVHNINKQTRFFNSDNYFSLNLKNQEIKTDTTKNNESKLYIYTNQIINSSIKYLINNL
jgi:uncharacterized protein YxeA